MVWGILELIHGPAIIQQIPPEALANVAKDFSETPSALTPPLPCPRPPPCTCTFIQQEEHSLPLATFTYRKTALTLLCTKVKFYLKKKYTKFYIFIPFLLPEDAQKIKSNLICWWLKDTSVTTEFYIVLTFHVGYKNKN